MVCQLWLFHYFEIVPDLNYFQADFPDSWVDIVALQSSRKKVQAAHKPISLAPSDGERVRVRGIPFQIGGVLILEKSATSSRPSLPFHG